jgi:hypothetical protein
LAGGQGRPGRQGERRLSETPGLWRDVDPEAVRNLFLGYYVEGLARGAVKG